MSKDARRKKKNRPAWGSSRIVQITSIEQLHKAIPDIEPDEIEEAIGGWWVLGTLCGALGPYDNRGDARECRKGYERSYREDPSIFHEPEEKSQATPRRSSNRTKQLSFLTESLA